MAKTWTLPTWCTVDAKIKRKSDDNVCTVVGRSFSRKALVHDPRDEQNRWVSAKAISNDWSPVSSEDEPPERGKRVVIEATGRTTSDLAEALEQVLESIRGGNVSGCDKNSDGHYSFEVSEVSADEIRET